MNASTRCRIAVYCAGSKFTDRDLSPAICDRLEHAFDTVWLASDTPPKAVETRAPVRIPRLSRFRFRVWLYLFELEKYAFRQPVFGAAQPLPHLGLSARSRAFLALVLRTGLAPLWRGVSRAVMRATAPPVKGLNGRIDACVCLSAPNDPQYDDLARYFRKRNAAIVAVPLNWDNASSKPYLESPDLVFTWGEQTAALSRQYHGVKSIALGSPRFDRTRVPPPPSTGEARARLGLRPDLTYLLFAGSGFPFDEIGALNTLAGHIKKTGRCDLRIIYRPHPMAWPRGYASELSEDARSLVSPDPTGELFEPDDLRIYQFLFKAASGVITPYSTMLVEASMYGLPVMALGYNSRRHPEFDWTANSTRQPHLRFTRSARWVVECHDEAQLTTAFETFLELLSDVEARQAALDDFAQLVRVTDRSYGEELTDALVRELACR